MFGRDECGYKYAYDYAVGSAGACPVISLFIYLGHAAAAFTAGTTWPVFVTICSFKFMLLTIYCYMHTLSLLHFLRARWKLQCYNDITGHVS